MREKRVGDGRSIVLHNIIDICNDKHFPFCSILVERHVEVDVCTNFAEDDWKEISNEEMAVENLEAVPMLASKKKSNSY